MRQLPMNLPWAEALGREDFMVSTANAKAMALVGGWPDWPQGRLALIGPEGAGKSHLAAIWAEETEARVVAAGALTPDAAPELAEGPLVIEDADRGVDEAALFHLWNACAGERRGLLMTGRAPPADWKVALPDLASRLSSLTPARIGDPDDALLSIVLLKLFADRQLVVKPALIGYLMGRMERSYVAARAMVDRLDAESLARGRPINQALAREILEG